METQPSLDLLLVEDSPDHAELATRVFQKLNPPISVKIIQDGQEALDFLFGKGAYEGRGIPKVKLLLLDLYLPKVPGIDVLRQIRSDPRTKDIPAAILTITGNERTVLEQNPFNVKHYIRKPLELSAFLEIYDTYIKGK